MNKKLAPILTSEHLPGLSLYMASDSLFFLTVRRCSANPLGIKRYLYQGIPLPVLEHASLNFCVFQEYGVNAIVSLVQKSAGEQLANIVLHPAAIKSIICAISPAPDKCCSLIFKKFV